MINKATAESRHLELKPGTCVYKTIGKEMFKLVCIMEAMMRAVLYYPPTASEDEAVSKCKEVCCIQQVSLLLRTLMKGTKVLTLSAGRD